MNKICVLLIYLLCFKRIRPETCDKFDKSRHSWFTSCRPPCHCTAYPGNDVYCILDDERECTGCAKLERKDGCTCSGDGCRCEQGERYCNNYCVAREEICDGKCEGDDRVCNGRCIRKEEECSCLVGQKLCNNRCIAREDMCDGKCDGDDRVCNERCIMRSETCNGKHCGELDWICNGECIPRTTKCYGDSYSAEGCGEGHWNCNGVCIREYQECNQKCNEALGYWMCGSHCRKGGQDVWESNGPSCQTKSTISRRVEFLYCIENKRDCDNKCIERWQPCNGVCNAAEGDWLCGHSCKTQEERDNWIVEGEACKPTQGNQKPTSRNETDTKTSTTPTGTSPLPVMVIVGVSSGAGFVLVAAVIVAICLHCRNKKKKRKEIQYIDDNPEYNYGEADDDIEVVDNNDYYGDSDEETHV